MRSIVVSRFSLLLTTIRSCPAMPVYVLTVCDSSTRQATKLLLKRVQKKFYLENINEERSLINLQAKSRKSERGMI